MTWLDFKNYMADNMVNDTTEMHVEDVNWSGDGGPLRESHLVMDIGGNQVRIRSQYWESQS